MTAKERLEAAAARTVMKLPDRALRKMVGEPTVVDGRTLDPRLQLMAQKSADDPSIAELDPVSAREAAASAFALSNARRAAGVSTHDMVVASFSAEVPVRVYRPPTTSGLRPGVMFMHQGGFVVGDLDTCDSFCSRLASDLGAVVVSVDYRMGPEHLFPAAAEDAAIVWAWVSDNAEVLGIDPRQRIVCGDSAGGLLAASLCQSLRHPGGEQPMLQVLIYPYVDATATGGSMETCADAFPLDSATMDWFGVHSLPDGFDRSDPRLSPALAQDLGGVAPAVVVTAGFDPLRDQGIEFALALRAAGVDVTDRCEDSLCHSFLALDGLVPEASAAVDRVVTDIARHL